MVGGVVAAAVELRLTDNVGVVTLGGVVDRLDVADADQHPDRHRGRPLGLLA